MITGLTFFDLERAKRHDRRAWLHFLGGNLSYALGSLRKADRNYARAAQTEAAMKALFGDETTWSPLERLLNERILSASEKMEDAMLAELWGDT